MTNQSDIERIVMRRVRTIRVLRLVLSGAVASCLVFLLALWGIGREVWVARVFQNMPHSGNMISVSRFYLDAFDNTRFAVQALTILTVASVIYFAREFSRTISLFFTEARA